MNQSIHAPTRFNLKTIAQILFLKSMQIIHGVSCKVLQLHICNYIEHPATAPYK
jgi:hypothetical protein